MHFIKIIKYCLFRGHSFIVFKYGLYFGGFGLQAELILRIWGAKEKYFQGAEVFSFRDLG